MNWKSIPLLSKHIKQEIHFYSLLLRNNHTPLISKVFLGIALGYLLLPFDFIPDWIPILGQLDDIIIVPLCIFLAMRFIPQEVIIRVRKTM
jgi:uncharacterized membrane protein YkvA (DUF1232 family)